MLTQDDFEGFHLLCHGTMSMVERHQRIYRLLLKAMNRSIDEIGNNEIICIVENQTINLLEELFAKAERRHFRTTFLSGYVIPIMQRFVNKRRLARK